jgi:50S ribosomal protein L16 3-hydroxylase
MRWSARDVRDFAGRYLSEPKHNVVFAAPRPALSRTAFRERAAREGVRLDPRSRLLFSGTIFFMNGEALRPPATAAAGLRRLADDRKLAGPVRAARGFWDAVHGWYLQGFVHAGRDR